MLKQVCGYIPIVSVCLSAHKIRETKGSYMYMFEKVFHAKRKHSLVFMKSR